MMTEDEKQQLKELRKSWPKYTNNKPVHFLIALVDRLNAENLKLETALRDITKHDCYDGWSLSTCCRESCVDRLRDIAEDGLK